jgi:DNA-directed RNA polymerase specialized sigma24 family protein
MSLPDTTTLSPDEYEALLASQDWATLARRLTEFAWRKIGRTSWEDAEDLAQTAIQRAFDARYQRWSPKTQPNLFWYLGGLVHGLISNRRQKKARAVEVLHDHEDLDALAPEAIDATDDVMARRQRARLIVLELERRVATDRAASRVLAAFRAEVDDPRAQAESAGLALQAVYNARSKLRALATEIAQTFDRGTPLHSTETLQ